MIISPDNLSVIDTKSTTKSTIKSTTKSTKSTTKKINNILYIIIFLIIIFFIVIIIVTWYSTNNNYNTNDVNTEVGLFLSPCSDNPCQDGLICDSSALICKKDYGSSCDNFFDCATDLFCSGICVNGSTGSFDEFCPCIPNGDNICVIVDNTTNETRCLLKQGQYCEDNNQCASFNCLNNKCQIASINSFPCLGNSDCTSGNCNNNFCQENRITSQIGSFCQGKTPDICYPSTRLPPGYTSGAQCDSEQKLTCVCDDGTNNNAGICKSLNNGVSNVCNNLSLCSSQLQCSSAINLNICDNITDCICQFNVDPNILNSNTSCIGGMTLSSDLKTCKNNMGLGCSSSNPTICTNSVCNMTIPVLSMYKFNNSTNIFNNSTNTSIIPIASDNTNLTYQLSPITMFSISYNAIDTIFLVDDNNGLLSLLNDTTRLPTPTNNPWNILLSKDSSQKTPIVYQRLLKYVAYNGIFWLFLFSTQETSTSTSYDAVFWTDTIVSGNSRLPNIISMFGAQPRYYNSSDASKPGAQFYLNVILSIKYLDISTYNTLDINPDNNVLLYASLVVTMLNIGKPLIILIRPPSSSISNYTKDVSIHPYQEVEPINFIDVPVKFYYDQLVTRSGSSVEICFLDDTEYCTAPSTDNKSYNCMSQYNYAYIADYKGVPELQYNIPNSSPLVFNGNFIGLILPTKAKQVDSEINNYYYNVFDFSIYTPGPTGLYYSADATICKQGIDNSNIIILSKKYRNISPTNQEFISYTVSLWNFGNIIDFPYNIDDSFKCSASNNAFYIISSGSCI